MGPPKSDERNTSLNDGVYGLEAEVTKAHTRVERPTASIHRGGGSEDTP